MSLSAAMKCMSGKTTREVQEEILKLYSSMTPEIFFEHTSNLQCLAVETDEIKSAKK